MWQFSNSPQKEDSWVTAKITGKTKYTIVGLTPALTYYFRVGIIDADGNVNYRTMQSLMVL